MRGRTPSDGTRGQPSSTTPDAARSHSKLEVLVWIEPGWRRPPDNVPPFWRLDEILDTGGLLRRFLVLAHWPSPYVGSTHQLLHGQVRRQSRGASNPFTSAQFSSTPPRPSSSAGHFAVVGARKPARKVPQPPRSRVSVERAARATRARA